MFRPILGGEQEAQLIALACSEPPAGQRQSSLRLLADTMVELRFVERVSHETVRRALKKNKLRPWTRREWVTPPEQNTELPVSENCCMEDVLDVYQRSHDPKRPVVCFDETNTQLIGETRRPPPATPGYAARVDYAYERRRTANLFLAIERLAGCRDVQVTEQRTRVDWARQINRLVDERYPEAERIMLVLDNLHTHTLGALYETFPAAEAKRLKAKLELHYTPKHESWLNVAEIELSVLARQCLNRRTAERTHVAMEVAAWVERRNRPARRADWHFTTGKTRTNFKRPYATFDESRSPNRGGRPTKEQLACNERVTRRR